MAAPPLLRVLSKAHQFLTFTTPPNLQSAVAFGLGKPDEAFNRHAGRAPALPRSPGLGSPSPRLPRPAGAGNLLPQRRSRAVRHDGRCRVLRDAGEAVRRGGGTGFGLLRPRTPCAASCGSAFRRRTRRSKPRWTGSRRSRGDWPLSRLASSPGRDMAGSMRPMEPYGRVGRSAPAGVRCSIALRLHRGPARNAAHRADRYDGGRQGPSSVAVWRSTSGSISSTATSRSRPRPP